MTIKDLTIGNFRGIEDLSLPLSPISLIVGKNNIGKTTVLEALFFLIASQSPTKTVAVASMRRHLFSDARELWKWLFNTEDSTSTIRIGGTDSQNIRNELAITCDMEGSQEIRTGDAIPNLSATESTSTSNMGLPRLFFDFTRVNKSGKLLDSLSTPAYFDGEIVRQDNRPLVFPDSYYLSTNATLVPESVTQFSDLQRRRKEDELVTYLRLLDDRMGKIVVTAIQQGSYLSCDIGGSELIPVSMMGGGFCRLLSIILLIMTKPKGIIIIDEVDTGFHHTFLPKLWSLLLSVAHDHGVQLVMTTHSSECLISLAQSNPGKVIERGITVLRLERLADSRLNAERYTLKQLKSALEFDFEVR